MAGIGRLPATRLDQGHVDPDVSDVGVAQNSIVLKCWGHRPDFRHGALPRMKLIPVTPLIVYWHSSGAAADVRGA